MTLGEESWLTCAFNDVKFLFENLLRSGAMIVGVGTDIVNIQRIESLYSKYQRRLVERILRPEERAFVAENHYDNPEIALYIAKRFAAKEAISKALGVGIGKSLSFQDIAVLNKATGAPEVYFFRDVVDTSKIFVHISISDDYPIAVAFCVISVYCCKQN
jgi:holo-[acyl-carrier protein] synthase